MIRFVLIAAALLGEPLDSIPAACISATRGEDKVIPAKIITREQIEQTGSASVADAMRYFSGAMIKDYGGAGGLKTVNVRSLGAEHTGVFYDGMQISSAQNGVVDLGRFSLENIESVSLFDGQKSSVLQSAKDYASASSVYLQTRRPRFDNGRKMRATASLSAGSFETFNPSIRLENALPEGIVNAFDASLLSTSGEYPFTYTKIDGYDTTAVRSNGDVSALRVEDGLWGDIPGGTWSLKLYYYGSDRGYPGAFVRTVPGYFTHQDRQTDHDGFAQASLMQTLGRWSYSLKFKTDISYLHYISDPRLDVTTMHCDNEYLQKGWYLSMAAEYALTSWADLSLSYDSDHSRLEANLTDFVYPQRMVAYTAPAISIHKGGFRMQANVLETFVRDIFRDGTSNAYSVWNPALVASYSPSETLRFSAFYKSIHRLPTFNDLYYTFIGNADLEPEKSKQLSFSLFWNPRNFELSASVFRNSVENKIVAVPASNQFRWTMMNIGLVDITGLDLSMKGQTRVGEVLLSGRLSYAFQQALDHTDSQSEWYGGQIAYIPRHSGSLVMDAAWRRLHLCWSTLYTGERYISSANIAENHLQPWYTSDCTLSWQGNRYRVFASINNIFNQQYEVVKCYPMPGVNFRVGGAVSL